MIRAIFERCMNHLGIKRDESIRPNQMKLIPLLNCGVRDVESISIQHIGHLHKYLYKICSRDQTFSNSRKVFK